MSMSTQYGGICFWPLQILIQLLEQYFRKLAKARAILYNNASFLIRFPLEVLQKTSAPLILSQSSDAVDAAKTPEASPIRPALQSRTIMNNLKPNSNVNRSYDQAKATRGASQLSGKGIISTLRELFWSFGNKKLDRKKSCNLAGSPPGIERDASVSDAIAHCRLSFDGRNWVWGQYMRVNSTDESSLFSSVYMHYKWDILQGETMVVNPCSSLKIPNQIALVKQIRANRLRFKA